MADENFLEKLLAEVEQKEEAQTEAYFDLVLMQIQSLNEQIARNFDEAEKQCKYINDFVLNKNTVISEKIKFLELKLKAFIVERKEKTIELPHGFLKMHKKPDKVQITDMELFLSKADKILYTSQEELKPNLNKIKEFIKKRPVPPGVTVIPGKEEFSYKIKGEQNDGRSEEIGAGAEQSHELRIVV